MNRSLISLLVVLILMSIGSSDALEINISSPTNTTYTTTPLTLNVSVADASNISQVLYSLNGGANGTVMNNHSLYNNISSLYVDSSSAFLISNSTEHVTYLSGVFYRYNDTSYVEPIYGCWPNTNYFLRGFATNDTGALNEWWILKAYTFAPQGYYLMHYDSDCNAIDNITLSGFTFSVDVRFRGLAVKKNATVSEYFVMNASGSTIMRFNSTGALVEEVSIDSSICDDGNDMCDLTTFDNSSFYSVNLGDGILYRFNQSGFTTGRLNLSQYTTGEQGILGIDTTNGNNFTLSRVSDSSPVNAGNIYEITVYWSAFETKSVYPAFGANNLVIFTNNTLGEGNSSTVYFTYYDWGNISIRSPSATLAYSYSQASGSIELFNLTVNSTGASTSHVNFTIPDLDGNFTLIAVNKTVNSTDGNLKALMNLTSNASLASGTYTFNITWTQTETTDSGNITVTAYVSQLVGDIHLVERSFAITRGQSETSYNTFTLQNLGNYNLTGCNFTLSSTLFSATATSNETVTNTTNATAVVSTTGGTVGSDATAWLMVECQATAGGGTDSDLIYGAIVISADPTGGGGPAPVLNLTAPLPPLNSTFAIISENFVFFQPIIGPFTPFQIGLFLSLAYILWKRSRKRKLGIGDYGLGLVTISLILIVVYIYYYGITPGEIASIAGNYTASLGGGA